MRRTRGFTLIELLVVVAIIALLISILLPSLSRARELSKRLVCAANAKGIGTSCKIYSNENEEMYPVPEHQTDIATVKKYFGLPTADNMPDTTDAAHGLGRTLVSNDTTTQMSTTRAFWMLIRTGDNTPKQYICPSSGDSTDPTSEIDTYYDFLNISHVSYGYQVPYGPSSTRPTEGLDTRMVIAADKGPYAAGIYSTTTQPPALPLDEASPPNEWKPFNSSNHGGRGAGEGQNCLYADAHAIFERKPIVGVDNDNIYTQMTNNALLAGRLYGKIPSLSPYPGKDTFGTDAYASTDTLIYP